MENLVKLKRSKKIHQAIIEPPSKPGYGRQYPTLMFGNLAKRAYRPKDILRYTGQQFYYAKSTKRIFTITELDICMN